jgi:hypothetical protein
MNFINYTEPMSIPNVDTFEHDIAEEIKTKEATLTDIASAGGDVSNVGNSRAQTSNLLIVLGVVFIVAVIGILIALVYFYGVKNSDAPLTETPANTATSQSNALLAISPTLHDALGGNIGKVSKSEYGYTLQVLSYSAVFSYMLKNEREFSDELAFSLGSPRDISTTTPTFSFTDLTLQNQNMRVGTAGSSTIVYAFVNTNTLLISKTPEGILTLRGAILSQ